jgi:hypothetical protein
MFSLRLSLSHTPNLSLATDIASRRWVFLVRKSNVGKVKLDNIVGGVVALAAKRGRSRMVVMDEQEKMVTI